MKENLPTEEREQLVALCNLIGKYEVAYYERLSDTELQNEYLSLEKDRGIGQ